MKAYTVVLSPDPNAGGYSVSVPAMPGALTAGKTRKAALAAAAEVMGLWLEVAAEHGEGPLEETREVVTSEISSILEDREAEGWDRTIETAVVVPKVLQPA